MKDAQRTEEVMGRVLAGLGSAEVPAGLEQRVLRAVEARVATASQGRRGLFGRVWPEVGGWTGAVWGAGVLAVGGGVVVLMMQMEGRHRVIAPWREMSRATVAFGSSASLGSQSSPAPNGGEMASSSIEVRRVEAAAHGGERRDRARREDAEFDQGSESIAMQEMRAPSMPAPPLPLTRQERLLLRVVEKGAPEEIAMLDPAQRAKAEELAKVEFQDFFEPPKPKLRSKKDETEITKD